MFNPYRIVKVSSYCQYEYHVVNQIPLHAGGDLWLQVAWVSSSSKAGFYTSMRKKYLEIGSATETRFFFRADALTLKIAEWSTLQQEIQRVSPSGLAGWDTYGISDDGTEYRAEHDDLDDDYERGQLLSVEERQDRYAALSQRVRLVMAEIKQLTVGRSSFMRVS